MLTPSWTSAKNMGKLAQLAMQVTSPTLLSNYASMLEMQHKYEEALRCYSRAKDAVNQTKLYLSLSKIDEALTVVRESRSREAAKLVAVYFERLGDSKTILEFYVLADMKNEACSLAKNSGLLAEYVELLGEQATTDDYVTAATFYEQRKESLLAGKFFMLAERYEPALAHFLRSGSPASLELAIDLVGKAKNDNLTHELIAYLMSGSGRAEEGSSFPANRDPKYIFKLYMSLGQFREAARTALIIAKEEWVSGSYRAARDLLFSTYQHLWQSGHHVPSQMRHMLMLLQSYLLVKARDSPFSIRLRLVVDQSRSFSLWINCTL
jgi:WD repeat-containing protein 19